MIYLVFTQDGFEQAQQMIVEDKAILWINADVLTDQQRAELDSAGIQVFTLADKADPSNEKSVLAALDYVEKNAPDCEIFVEYL